MNNKVWLLLAGIMVIIDASSVSVAGHPKQTPEVRAAQFAYVCNSNYGGGGNTISEFSIQTDGSLSPLSPAMAATGAGLIFIASDLSQHYVYAVNGTAHSISQFRVEPSGVLAPLSPRDVPAGQDCTTIVFHPSNKFAYVVDTSGSILQFRVRSNGSLAPLSPPVVFLQGAHHEHPSAIILSQRGDYAYVPSISGAIFQYQVAANGALLPLSPPTVATGQHPWVAALSPHGNAFYAAAADESAIYQYRIAVTGSLSAFSPIKLSVGDDPGSIAFDPTKHFAYVVCQRDGNVYSFHVGPDGALTPLTVEKMHAGRLGAIFFDASGAFAYVTADQGTILQYRISTAGTFSPLNPAFVSGNGGWKPVKDKSGHFVYYSGASISNTVSQYQFNTDGTLSQLASPEVESGDFPTDILILQPR